MNEILAVPLIIPSTDFNLNKVEPNRNFLIKLLKKKPQIVDSYNDHDIYHYGDSHNGAYFIYDSELQLITYFMRYEGKNRKFANGLQVTQTTVWRSGALKGISDYVVFNILLKKYPVIVSDKEQTESGKRLWFDLMNSALKSGNYHVGAVDFSNMDVQEITVGAQLRLWYFGDLNSPWVETDLHKEKQKARAVRFFISTKPVN